MMKKRGFLLIIFFILFLFGSCNQADTLKEESREGSVGNSSGDSNSSRVNAGDIAVKPVQEIDKILKNGIKVQAPVKIASNIALENLKTYIVQGKKHDFEKAKELLLAEREIVSSEVNSYDAGTVINVIETKEGYSLMGSSEGGIRLYGPLSQEISDVFINYYLNPMKNDESFLAKNDLSFSSREQVVKESINILSELDIDVDSSPMIYSFSKGDPYTVLAFSQDGVVEKTTFFSQDCYLLEFQITVENMPVSKEMSGSVKAGNSVGGTAVKIVYSSQGIEDFSFEYDYSFVKNLSENQKAITAEEALEKLDEKYDSIILEGGYTVERINFEYIPIQDQKENQVILAPVWRFGINHAIQFPGKEDSTEIVEQSERSFIIFDAITGEEILTDAGSI